MRRKRWLMGAAATVLAGVPMVRGAATAQPGQHDRVVGSGRAFFYGQFEVDVRSGPSAEVPIGAISVDGEYTYTAPVTCLAVRRNVATFSVEAPFSIIKYELTDNAGLGIPDVINSLPTQDASDCSPLGNGVAFGLDEGDIAIIGGTTPPASVRDCRDGGYTDFGFTSEGRCRASVIRDRARAPRKP